MTIIEAFKTGKPLTRKNRVFSYESTYTNISMPTTHIIPGTFIDPWFLLSTVDLSIEDILAKDWVVKKK